MSTEWRQRIKVRKEEGKKGKKEVWRREGGKEGRDRKKEKGRKKEILNEDHRAWDTGMLIFFLLFITHGCVLHTEAD